MRLAEKSLLFWGELIRSCPLTCGVAVAKLLSPPEEAVELRSTLSQPKHQLLLYQTGLFSLLSFVSQRCATQHAECKTTHWHSNVKGKSQDLTSKQRSDFQTKIRFLSKGGNHVKNKQTNKTQKICPRFWSQCLTPEEVHQI